MPEANGRYQLSRLLVFRVLPYATRDDDPPVPDGGFVALDGEIRGLFESAFRGAQAGRVKPQPFHFNFSGTDRKHAVRDLIQQLVTNDGNSLDSARQLAARLSSVIDNRTGELLLTIGCGTHDELLRCAIWAYPADESLQFRSVSGKPEIREIKDAFSKSSDARKAVFLDTETPIGRNDLVNGQIFDRTANRAKGSSDYWMSKFLDASIELYPARGTSILLGGLKTAHSACKSPEEKASVRAVFDRLLAGNFPPTTLNGVHGQLVGEAKVAFGKSIPKTVEADATFVVDNAAVASKIKMRVYVLTSGIEVYFPHSSDVDPEDYIKDPDGVRRLVIDEPIRETYFK